MRLGLSVPGNLVDLRLLGREGDEECSEEQDEEEEVMHPDDTPVVPCPFCAGQVIWNAPACPRCGWDNPDKEGHADE